MKRLKLIMLILLFGSLPVSAVVTYDADYFLDQIGYYNANSKTQNPIYLFMDEVGSLLEGETGTGKFWFVDSGATGNADGKKWVNASLTIDAAINLSDADGGADRGDRIYVAQGHTETKSATGALFTADIAGMSIRGLGKGDNRPKLTLSHTGAKIDLTADNVLFDNIYVDATGVDSVDAPINISGEGSIINRLFFRLADTNGQADKGITIGLADGDANDLIITNSVIVAPDTGAVSAITFAFDMENVILANLYIYGDFTTAAVEVPAGGDAQENLTLDNCTIISKNSGQPAFEANGTGNTGVIRNSVLISDAEATIVDAGGLQIANSTSLLLIGDSEGAALPANMTLIDLIGDFTGPDSGSAQTENIKASLDLAHTDLDALLDMAPKSIKDTGVALTGGNVVNCFVIAGGPIIVHSLIVEITTGVDAQTALLSFQADPTSGSATPISNVTGPDIASASQGDFFYDEGDGTAMVKAATGTALPKAYLTGVGIIVPAGDIDMLLSASAPTTGVATIYMRYTPMVTGVTVTAP